MRFSEPGRASCEVSIALRRGESMEPVFRASLDWSPHVTACARSVRAAARHACGSWQVMALIRLQGIRLWLRRLPLVPRHVRAPVSGGSAGMSASVRAVRRPRDRRDGPWQAPRRRRRHKPVHTAIARGSSTSVAPRSPVRVELPDGRVDAARGGPDAPRDAHRRQRRVLPPARRRRPDRVRRGVHGRRLGRRRPRRGARSRSRRAWPRSSPRGCSACATSTCGTTRPAREHRSPARGATSSATTTCPTICSRCSSTSR